MINSLVGKNVVVSGAAGGVGREVVAKLAALGANICATDITPNVNDLKQSSGPGNVVATVGDVTRSSDVDKIFMHGESAFGSIDVLVSNAGYIVSKPILETSEAEWDDVMNANAKSLFLMAKRALPGMIAARQGSIVATGSISSVLGLTSQAAYCASKGALLQLVRQLAVDYAGSGVRVNAVGAGSINTPFLTRYLEGLEDPEAGMRDIIAAHPMGRWAEPGEIADAIIYLAGANSSFVTGQILMADGGYSAR